MKTLTHNKKSSSFMLTGLIALLAVSISNAQVVRPYTAIYADNIRGGHTIIGNTLSAIYTSGSGSTGTINTAQMNDFNTSGTGNYTYGRTSAYGNDNSNIQLVDVDGISQTTNSSSANLNLPGGINTIKFARLYWGGRISTGDGGANNINLRTAKIRFNAENYQTITAAAGSIDKSFISSNDTAYQAYIDLTSYVNSRGNGTYYIADVTAATGSTSGGGFFAGWALVVVYENLAMPYSTLRVYDGFLQVYNGGSGTTQTITLNGLNPPANFALPSDAYMSMVSWEGDANLAASAANPNGDYVKVNGTAVANAVNPVTNFWNGTISKNGIHQGGDKNPDFKNQMGIDIDEVEIGTGFGITRVTTNINVEFGTEADQYFPSIFAFTMKTKPPLVQLDKSVKDTASGNAPWQIPNGLINPNEILTYTITGKNLGSGNALNCVIADTIPVSLSYRANSLKVNAPTPGIIPGFMTDAEGDDAAFKMKYGSRDYIKFFIGTGATPLKGGILAPGDSFNVQFQCIAPSTVNTINFVSNTARITGTEQDGVTPFVDDGTAIMGPQGGGVPIKMGEFTVQELNHEAILKWTTILESKNDHFEIERSTDAINFIKTGSVNGYGNSSEARYYQFNDPINISAKIIYYRLKIVDIDNKSSYSKILALRLDGLGSLNNFTVYPNPFDADIRLQVNSSREKLILVRISDASGKEEVRYNITLLTGENIVVITHLESLAKGIHFLEIITTDEKYTQRIMKR